MARFVENTHKRAQHHPQQQHPQQQQQSQHSYNRRQHPRPAGFTSLERESVRMNSTTTDNSDESSFIRDEFERLRQYRKRFDEKLSGLKQTLAVVLDEIDALRLMNEQLYRAGVARVKSFKKINANTNATTMSVNSSPEPPSLALPSTVASSALQASAGAGESAAAVDEELYSSDTTLRQLSSSSAEGSNPNSNSHSASASSLSSSSLASLTPLSSTVSSSHSLLSSSSSSSPSSCSSSPAESVSMQQHQHQHQLSFRPTSQQIGSGAILSDDRRRELKHFYNDKETSNSNSSHTMRSTVETFRHDSRAPPVASDTPTQTQSQHSSSSLSLPTNIAVQLNHHQHHHRRHPTSISSQSELSIDHNGCTNMVSNATKSAPISLGHLDTLRTSEQIDRLTLLQINTFIDVLYEVSQETFTSHEQILREFEHLYNGSRESEDLHLRFRQAVESELETSAQSLDVYACSKSVNESKETMDDSGAASDDCSQMDSSKDSVYFDNSDEEKILDELFDRSTSSSQQCIKTAQSPDSQLFSSLDDLDGKLSQSPSRAESRSCSLASISESPTPQHRSSSPPPPPLPLSPPPLQDPDDLDDHPTSSPFRVRLRPVRRSQTFQEPSSSHRLAQEKATSGGGGCIVSDPFPTTTTATSQGDVVSTDSAVVPNFASCRNMWERRSLNKHFKFQLLKAGNKKKNDENL